ncbi:DinB family protein [Kribbella qitaiheensis]|uniref:DinB family protein n=1 Tax=Kribbella qitaiheensis TaxID=1544730 RepID=A0A7G6WTT5_9ACTN|nr:DinB family protein [Kribbella qitaiheensis]QNE17400.1 DinB family protein [Kribbella qitaiheensis]
MPTSQTRRRKRDTGPPRVDGDEKATLLAFLDYLREAIANKAAGAPEPQIRTAGVRSGTNVLGLVKHLTYVERFYLLGEEVRDWGGTMRPDPMETIDSVTAAYREAITRSNEVIATYTDLGLPAPRTVRNQEPPSMRWLLVHLIEETGRHAGHADILREQIDHTTGR